MKTILFIFSLFVSTISFSQTYTKYKTLDNTAIFQKTSSNTATLKFENEYGNVMLLPKIARIVEKHQRDLRTWSAMVIILKLSKTLGLLCITHFYLPAQLLLTLVFIIH